MRPLRATAALLLGASPLQAQHLRDELSQLVIFGDGGQQLFLRHDAAAQGGLMGEEHARHAATAELALDGVGVAQCRLDLLAEFGRHPLTEIWKTLRM